MAGTGTRSDPYIGLPPINPPIPTGDIYYTSNGHLWKWPKATAYNLAPDRVDMGPTNTHSANPTPTVHAASSGKLNHTALKALWISAGGSPAKADIAAAIAQAESGGDPTQRYNPGPQEDSRGLWQINVVANANPQYARTNLYNPLTNARIAVRMSKNGTNWGPWTTYTSGRYEQFLGGKNDSGGSAPPAAAATPTSSDGGGGGNGIVGVAADVASVAVLGPLGLALGLGDKVDNIVSVPGKFLKLAVDVVGILFDKDTWFRIGKTITGSIVLLIGVGALVVVAVKTFSPDTFNAAKKAATKGVL